MEPIVIYLKDMKKRIARMRLIIETKQPMYVMTLRAVFSAPDIDDSCSVGLTRIEKLVK